MALKHCNHLKDSVGELSKLYIKTECFGLCTSHQEQFMRAVLFAQHLSQLAAEGYGLDEASRANLQRPAQEALMKLFAVRDHASSCLVAV